MCVGDGDNVLGTDVGESLNGGHLQVGVEVDAGRLVRVLGGQDQFDWELLLHIVAHHGSLEHEVVAGLFAGESYTKTKGETLTKNVVVLEIDLPNLSEITMKAGNVCKNVWH